ncbi:hypothetical protein [Nostoc sp. TCL240-02]|uniref:hypothetical protein n=1 Tax=Nostoc sp. TCL240-02 TaxID=2572090 RepID=UPI00157FB5C8|nr:hypothetical protein [Nostoc sp. TCL240-02]
MFVTAQRSATARTVGIIQRVECRVSKEKADQECQRAERLAEYLRSQGVDPDSFS